MSNRIPQTAEEAIEEMCGWIPKELMEVQE